MAFGLGRDLSDDLLLIAPTFPPGQNTLVGYRCLDAKDETTVDLWVTGVTMNAERKDSAAKVRWFHLVRVEVKIAAD